MAKKKKVAAKGTLTKSQAVRDQLKKTPNATAAEIAKSASKRTGETISESLVFAVRSAGVSKKKKRSKKKVATKAAAPASVGGMNAALIKEAATLLQQAGGDTKAAREALDLATAVSRIVKK